MAYQGGEDLFRVDSWVSVMLGQRVVPGDWHPLGQLLKPGELQQALSDLKRGIAKSVGAMPAHEVFVQGYCAA